jgi:competence protein ComEC
VKALRQAPAARLLIPFVAGILLAFAGVEITYLYWLILPAAVLFYLRRFRPFIAFFLMIAAGCGSVSALDHQLANPSWAGQDYLVASLSSPLREGSKTWRGVFDVGQGIHSQKSKPCDGKILLYLKKSPETAKLEPGDQIILRNRLQTISPAVNQGQFDSRYFWRLQHITHSAYLDRNDFIRIRNNHNGFNFHHLRSLIRRQLFMALPDPSARGIAEALLIGETVNIRPEVMSNFSITGTVHILSVSGMHVGAFAALLFWLLAGLNRTRNLRIIRLFLMLSVLWGYAVLTGLSAPVCRAVVTFSFVLIGVNLSRPSNMYNSIFLAALVLLAADPYFLMQTGFQLSFAAVLGIVWLQPKLSGSFTPKNKIVTWLWELTTASFAAQLATLPFCLYYFHRFPTWFLLTNPVIVLLSTVVMAVAAIYVLLSLCTIVIPGLYFLSFLAAVNLRLLLEALLKIAEWFAHFPDPVLKGFYFSAAAAVLFGLFILALCTAVAYGRKQWLWAALSVGACLAALQSFERYTLHKKADGMAFFSVPRHLLAATATDGYLYALADSDLAGDERKCRYLLANYAAAAGYAEDKIKIIPLATGNASEGGNFRFRWPYLMQGKHVYTMKKSGSISGTPILIHPRIRDTAIFARLEPRSVVIVAAAGKKTAQIMQEKANERKLNLIDLNTTFYRTTP